MLLGLYDFYSVYGQSSIVLEALNLQALNLLGCRVEDCDVVG